MQKKKIEVDWTQQYIAANIHPKSVKALDQMSQQDLRNITFVHDRADWGWFVDK